MYQKHIVCLFSCDYFTFFNIDSERIRFSKKCGTHTPFLFRIFTPNLNFFYLELKITSSVNSQVPLNVDFSIGSNGNYQSRLKTDQLLSSKGDQLMEENAPKDQLIIGSPGVRYLEDEVPKISIYFEF